MEVLGILGLMCSLLGSVAVAFVARQSIWGYFIPSALLGLILSVVALSSIRRGNRRGLLIALAGVAIGAGVLVVVVAFVVWIVISFRVSPP